MKINEVLNQIFNSWTHVAVLRVLNAKETGISGREVARLAKVNHRTAMLVLASLEKLELVHRLIGGRDHIFTLNRTHYFAERVISVLFAEESNFTDGIYNQIRKRLEDSSSSLIVYDDPEKNDAAGTLRVCIVYKHKKDEIEEIIPVLTEKLKKKYSITLIPYLISENAFYEMAKNSLMPVPSIVSKGIVISGKTLQKLTKAD